MNYGSPLKQSQKKVKEEKETESLREKPLERFKPIKPVITKSDAKHFVDRVCDTQ